MSKTTRTAADTALDQCDIIDRARNIASDAQADRLIPALDALARVTPHQYVAPARAFATLASTALSGVRPADKAALDLGVFDPGMVSCGGHHIQFNRFLIDALAPRGLSFRILAGNSACTKRFGISPRFQDVFRLNPYEHDELITTARDALAMNLLFVLEFAAADLPHPRAWLCHSLRITNILALAEIARHADAPLIGTVVEFDHLAQEHEHADLADDVYAVFFDLTRARSAHVRLTCETKGGARYLNAIAAARGSTLRLTRSHYLPAIWNARQHRSPLASGHATCLGFVGGTRASRGADVLPAAIIGSCARYPQITWKVQYDRAYLVSQMPGDVVRAWDTLITEGRLSVLGQGLDSSAYYGLLNAIDVLVLPYTERYNHSGSGVFHEALSFAKVVLPMAGSTMARDLDRAGIGGPRIAACSAAQIIDAIGVALADPDGIADIRRRLTRDAGQFDQDLDAFLDALTLCPSEAAQ